MIFNRFENRAQFLAIKFTIVIPEGSQGPAIQVFTPDFIGSFVSCCGAYRRTEQQREFLEMSETNSIAASKGDGTKITRFNALRHGVLSRYTVLPWEDADEYGTLLASPVAEHQPQGPTEEHLVEELAGVLWRKRRLRLAEAAAHRRGLENSFSQYRETAKAALAHITSADKGADISEAVRITPADTEEELRDLDVDEAMTRYALENLEFAKERSLRSSAGGIAGGYTRVVGGYTQTQTE